MKTYVLVTIEGGVVFSTSDISIGKKLRREGVVLEFDGPLLDCNKSVIDLDDKLTYRQMLEKDGQYTAATIPGVFVVRGGRVILVIGGNTPAVLPEDAEIQYTSIWFKRADLELALVPSVVKEVAKDAVPDRPRPRWLLGRLAGDAVAIYDVDTGALVVYVITRKGDLCLNARETLLRWRYNPADNGAVWDEDGRLVNVSYIMAEHPEWEQ